MGERDLPHQFEDSVFSAREAAPLGGKDRLGSVRATVANTGAVVGYYDCDPWGYILVGRSVNSVCGPTSMVTWNKFTGKEWDDEFGVNWNYFGAKYYDPQIGRWMVVDPLAEKCQSFSPYNYAANNPIILYDPDGRSIWTKIVKVAVKLYKTGDAASAFADNVKDVKTILNPAATAGEEVVAGASLVSELAPVSVGDVPDVAKAADKGLKIVLTKAG